MQHLLGETDQPSEDGQVQVLIVRTLRDSHWTIPKVTQPNNRSRQESAVREAFHEAGVRGVAQAEIVGVYAYARNEKDYRVNVMPLLVQEIQQAWPEQRRARKWCSLELAGRLIKSDDLSRIVLSFTTAVETAN